jgi:hypothetical protein
MRKMGISLEVSAQGDSLWTRHVGWLFPFVKKVIKLLKRRHVYETQMPSCEENSKSGVIIVKLQSLSHEVIKLRVQIERSCHKEHTCEKLRVQIERSCHKEHTCEIWKPYNLL